MGGELLCCAEVVQHTPDLWWKWWGAHVCVSVCKGICLLS